jgi:hypothetical protein
VTVEEDMLKTFNLVSISLFILLLSGCTTPKLLTATEESVSYEYDNNFISSKFVAQTAAAHCAKYGKKAELRSTTISSDNKRYTDIFDCR